jgi:hypothetical protein
MIGEEIAPTSIRDAPPQARRVPITARQMNARQYEPNASACRITVVSRRPGADKTRFHLPLDQMSG